MRKFRISESVKDISKISFGTVVGQIISILTLPVITRIYSVEIIGTWTTINALSSIVQNICDLGLSNTLMMCDDKNMQKLHSIITMISAFISGLSVVVVFLYYAICKKDLSESIFICVLMAVYAFTLRQISISQIILNRNQQYSVLMNNSIIRFSTTALVSILLGMIGIKSGYYFGNIFGQILPLLHMKRYLPKLQFVGGIDEYKNIIVDNRNYVKYQMPASLTVTLRTELPNLLIGGLFGNTILGYYSISQKLLTIPVTFLGQSLGKVFYQKIAAMRRNGQKIGKFVEKNVRRGMVLAIIPMSFLAAFGDVAVTLFFGLEYSIGGVICRIIVYRSLFNFISTAISGLDVVLDKQQYVLYTCLSQTVLSAISVCIGFFCFHSIYAATVFIVVTFIAIQIAYYCKMYQVMELSVKKYLAELVILMIIFTVASFSLRYISIMLINVMDFDLLNRILQYFV